MTKYLILQELFNIQQQHSPKFGESVICLDKSGEGYWRKDILPGYKSNRKKGRDASEINFGEVFKEIDVLINQIKINLPWKVVEVTRSEADDVILVLAKEYREYENILIHSPDKDMIQAQQNNDTVFQYSALTKKWIIPENKHDSMDHWLQEHIILGDASDEVPKVIDHTEFSDTFIKYLKFNNVLITSPHEFKTNKDIDKIIKIELLNKFDIFKLNRKGESTGVKDIYKDIKFGPATLQKKITEFGTLDKWLDSHPLYRQHYNRNFTLVMEEGIPIDIRDKILIAFKDADVTYNEEHFKEFLHQSGLKTILMDLPNIFKVNQELTIENCGW
jgi:5'-3' exonuclease